MNALNTRPTPLDRVRQLEALAPRRLTGTPQEKAVQEKLGAELEPLGFTLSWRPFRFGQHLYFALMLTFGLAVLGTAVAYWSLAAALTLHVFAAVSYTLESLRMVGPLRGLLLPQVSSQNLLATLPAQGAFKKRVVLMAHSDAAYTGLVFHPTLIRLATREPPKPFLWFKKQLGLATLTVALLALLDALALAQLWVAPSWLYLALTLPAFITFAANVDVVVRDTVVPGACDNLSGCSGSVELAHRFAGKLPEGVELVVVFSGAEEAGTGGAIRLAEQLEKSGEWKKDETTIVVIDTLSNGTLRYVEEGELWRVPVPPRIKADLDAVSAEGPLQVPQFIIPTGATDALAFQLRGWNAAGLTCVDETIGAPREYHYPTDTWTNLDEAQLSASLDFIERLLKRLVK